MTFTLPINITSRPVAVIGAGTLGRRIATMFATQGGVVRVFDPSQESRQSALTYASETLPDVVATIEGGIPGTIEGCDDMAEAVADAWLVIEAVPEHLEVKKSVFGDLDALAESDAVLASNSSSFASSMFIEHVNAPERVLNMHFYMPPAQRAVDLMSCGSTDPQLMAFMKNQLARFGLAGFEAQRESTGFIFNRIWAAIKRESLMIVAQGVAEPEDVDGMWTMNTGISTGPFHAMDLIGLDVVLDIENHYAAEYPHLPPEPRELLHRYVHAGNLGVKTGQGFYVYDTANNGT